MARPFLKWPGGKRLLARSIVSLFPPKFNRYIEPFAGGAAIFFFLEPQRAILSDINAELIEVYDSIKRDPAEVIRRLNRLRISETQFYQLRRQKPRTPVARAVRFLYLNRTAFNGIYRVNRAGQFNVPFGCKQGTILCDPPLIRTASELLQRTELRAADFETVLGEARVGDLVYADPPYTTVHDKNGFRRYNEALFTWSDQKRLADAANRAAVRGATVVVSNAHHPDLRKLYSRFAIVELRRASCIAGRARHRKQVAEFVFVATQKSGGA